MSQDTRILLPGTLPDPLSDFPFTRDWVTGRGSAREFLPWPEEETGWAEAVRARDARPVPPLDAEAVGEIERFNRDCGNTAGAALAAGLADPRTLVIVTGQQPNLLASPLYILLKALTACALARRVARESHGSRSVVPLFWVASDDHDFHELRDFRLAAPDGNARNLGEIATRGGAPSSSPAFEWKLEREAVDRLLRTAEELLPAKEKGSAARELLRETLSGSEPDFESLFCRTLAALLGPDYPMLFVAPRMTWMRRAQRPILRADFENPREAARLLEESGARMASAGYNPQIARDRNVLNAFYLHERSRLRLVWRGAEVAAEDPATRTLIRRFSPDELLAELDQAPERFSPNVVTRPMVQDSVLPTLAYVGGPGEVSYLAQLAPVYQAFGVARSRVTLRVSATVIPSSTARELDALGVRPVLASRAGSPEDPAPPALDELLSDLLLSPAPGTAPLLARVRQFSENVDQQIAGLREAADAARQPHVIPALEKTAHSIHQSLEQLQRRLWRQVANEGGEAWQRYLRATALLQPGGPPQERILAPQNFLAGYTCPDALAAELARKLDFTTLQPQIVWLEGG